MSRLDSLFDIVENCKEHSCSLNKKNIEKIYKADNGIKDISVKNAVFGNISQPQLCDCVIEYNSNKIALIEIKCGKVTKRVLEEIITQLKNTFKVLKYYSINITKCIFIYKSFDDRKTRQLLQSRKNFINGIQIIEKQYKNQAIDI